MKRILMILLAALGIVGAGAVAAVIFLDINLKEVIAQEEKEPTAEELAARSFSMEPLTTNLTSENYAVVQLNLLADSEKSYKELEVRTPELKAIVISTLAGLSRDDLKGSEGLTNFAKTIQAEANKVLHDGQVERVLITDFKIQ
ncbi:flagellar basal body-associated FliL family protein [Guptibacillus hwajinpoensis]|uniref:Flagellar protein FliL n=1 Tax=Guptibacillus hwajinpoensis TaxID=208199 RepID=A0ABU0K1P8_9BACL|nr:MULTISPECIES: flagellar basal body-associated FliL family protein [Alkalihalobacillus]MDP4551453.1 flagellar basal body-associated FliL family protein [Alkalihalobacillus macyae]MDQ0482229.1 flagellar FliL protein [Alkalihalobacillus hemicentroti]